MLSFLHVVKLLVSIGFRRSKDLYRWWEVEDCGVEISSVRDVTRTSSAEQCDNPEVL